MGFPHIWGSYWHSSFLLFWWLKKEQCITDVAFPSWISAIFVIAVHNCNYSHNIASGRFHYFIWLQLLFVMAALLCNFLQSLQRQVKTMNISLISTGILGSCICSIVIWSSVYLFMILSVDGNLVSAKIYHLLFYLIILPVVISIKIVSSPSLPYILFIGSVYYFRSPWIYEFTWYIV